ncbi:hypothetical protein BMETH_1912_0 [methanotrophic bacterial endosymbiont of Bathymodiolus sp.]|nr:hypothetical protein BMETH_1912_0 [methanotrophic bacterial endosymbiont of Bathymodiolus sp.]
MSVKEHVNLLASSTLRQFSYGLNALESSLSLIVQPFINRQFCESKPASVHALKSLKKSS